MDICRLLANKMDKIFSILSKLKENNKMVNQARTKIKTLVKKTI